MLVTQGLISKGKLKNAIIKVLFFKISIFSLITIIAMVISLLCVHCHSHSFARTWTEKKICRSKDRWLDFVTVITCIWVESSLGQLVGQSVVQPSRGVRVGYCSSNCCFIWKCWQCSYSDHVSIWLQLWCKGTRSTAKVRRQRAFCRDGSRCAG